MSRPAENDCGCYTPQEHERLGHDAENDAPHEHDQAPTDPADGERFACARCGVAFEYVDLHDGQPGEWVSVTPPATTEEAP